MKHNIKAIAATIIMAIATAISVVAYATIIIRHYSGYLILLF